MCGRFALSSDMRVITTRWNAAPAAELPERNAPRDNIKPTEQILVAALGSDGRRKIVPMKWGLVPSWSPEPKSKMATFNARAEGIATSKVFGPSFQGQRGRGGRCLIPFDAFYEWSGPKGQRVPNTIRVKSNQVMAFAGVWSSWRPKGSGGEGVPAMLLSCAIITVPANSLLQPIHDRMPAIMDDDAYSLWLGERGVGENELADMMKPYPAEKMEVEPGAPFI